MNSSSILACTVLAGAFAFAGEAEAANVVINGSFEQGTPNVTNPADVTGWTGVRQLYNHPYSGIAGIRIADTGGAQSTAATGNFNFNSLTYGVNDTVAASIGSKFHGLSTNGGAASSQIVTTLALNAAASNAQIDAGVAQFAFSSWLTSYTNDANTPALRVRFFDTDGGTGALLGTFTLDRGVTTNQVTTAQFLATGNFLNGAEDSRTDADYWALYEVMGVVPVGTRSAIVDIVAGTGHVNASQHDWYVDNIVLDVVPEPSVALLGGLGALSLLRRRRQS